MKRVRDERRELLRLAVRLTEQLHRPRPPQSLDLPESQWQQCQRLARLYQKACSRGWHAASARLRPRLEHSLLELRQNLAFPPRTQPPRPLSLRSLYAELVGLASEFPGVEYDLRTKTITVVTEPVVLEDVDLGAFRIVLELGGLGESPCYRARPIDPHPAGADEDVTHPHVRDETLCEGEGTLPIRSALAEGRLGDFFQVTSQVLQTYNPGSAYVPLEEWEGIACSACGDSVGVDQRTSCHGSGEDLCYGCAVTCAECGHHYAPAEADRCEDCDKEFCQTCLSEGLCDDCREQADHEQPDKQPAAAPMEIR